MCEKKLIKRSFIILSVGSFVSYLLLHVSFLLAESFPMEFWSEAMEYVRFYLTRAWEFLFPVALSAICYELYKRSGFLRALFVLCILSLSRLFYSLFYYYIYFLTLGFHTDEAIPFSLLASAAMVILTVLQVLGLTLCGYLALRIYRSKYKGSCEGSAGVFVFGGCVGEFLLFFVYEIIDTVGFFIEYGFDFKPSEILIMCFNYLFILALSVVAFFFTRRLSFRISDN